MVRLRSNRWYSADNQSRIRQQASQQVSGTRRLMSLVFMLALVILLMQKAGDPKYVRQAFQALGVPLDRQVVTSTDSATFPVDSRETFQKPDATGQHDVSDSERWRATCQDLVPKILGQATPTEVNDLAKCWFGHHPRPESSATTQQLSGLAKTAELILADARSRLQSESQSDLLWLMDLHRFSTTWMKLREHCTGTAVTSEPNATWRSSLTPPFQEALTECLDQKLLELLRDASPWNADENTAFGRLLQRGSNYQSTPNNTTIGSMTIPLTSARQLDGQTAQYFGQWVRFQGSVRRVEKILRSHPAFDIDQYWVMWLRGADGFSQPVAVYTTHPLAQELAQQIQSDLFPEVEITGLVAKRLAYSAQSGVEVAPTLFSGTIVQITQDEASSTKIDLESAKRQTWQAIAMGIAMSLVAALLVFRKLRAKSKRSVFKTTQILLLGSAYWISCPSVLVSQELATPPWVQTEQPEQKIVEIARARLADSLASTDSETIDQLLSEQPSTLSDSVLRVMASLDQIGWQRLRAAGRSIPVGGSWHLQPVELQGWACDVIKIPLDARQQERFLTSTAQAIYRLQVALPSNKTAQNDASIQAKLTDESSKAIALCAQVPSFWIGKDALYQPVRLQGFALMPREATDAALDNDTFRQLQSQTKTLCLLSAGVDWGFFDLHQSANATDAQPSLMPNVKPSWLELAQAGWNLSWMDLLSQMNQKRLSASESPPLRKMLEITAQESDSVQDAVQSPIEVMKDPLGNIGSAIDWRIRLVHGSLVQWSSPDSQVQATVPTGYYQYDGFVKIPGQQINYQAEGAEQPVSFREEFPVTVLMQADSPFVSQEAISSGQTTWNIGRTARVTCRFYRFWSYHSQRLSTQHQSIRQIVPLVVASNLEADRPTPRQMDNVGWFGYAMAVAILVVLVAILVSVFNQTFR